MNYYSHHIGDYTTDTAHLSLLEDGAYRRLMDRYYTTEAPLPADEAALFRVVRARLPDEQEAVRVVLVEFFDLTDAGWTHKRCDAEIEAFKAKSGKAADAANKRWGKSGNATAGTAPAVSAMPTQCGSNANALPTINHKPLTITQEPPTSTDASAPAAGGGDVPMGKDDFAPPAAAPLPARQDLPAPASTANAISVALRPLGVGATSMNPIVIGWAERGVAVEVLIEAVRIAREHKGDESIPPKYLAPIVERLLNPPERRSGLSTAGPTSQKFNFAHVDRSADVAAMQAGLAARGVTAADLDDDSPL